MTKLLLSGCVLQAGQYIKVQLVDGEVFQRIGLYVQGVPSASLQEQVRGREVQQMRQ